MPEASKARAVGFNHVAIEVGDIDEALEFYGRLFDFKLRGRSNDAAFIDLGDQFLALQKGRRQAPDDGRHFGLVVDDKEAVRAALKEAGVEVLPGRFLDFLDPWGNRIEIVGYDNIQFTKAPNVLRGHGAIASGKERAGARGAEGQGHGAGLSAHRSCSEHELPLARRGRAGAQSRLPDAGSTIRAAESSRLCRESGSRRPRDEHRWPSRQASPQSSQNRTKHYFLHGGRMDGARVARDEIR
jgi:lactoylglutathione lyase